MSTQIGGQPASITTPTTILHVGISSSTNATPIVVTTSANHGLNVGDFVWIFGHATNTAANGLWRVGGASFTATTISLYQADGTTASVGNGVGVATGFTQNWAMGATMAIPSDGDTFSVASVNVALQALADRTAYLWRTHRPVRSGTIPDAATTIGIEADEWVCAVPTANPRVITVRDTASGNYPVPNLGDTVTIIAPSTGAGSWSIQRQTGGTVLATIGVGVSGWAKCTFRPGSTPGSGLWMLSGWGGSTTATTIG